MNQDLTKNGPRKLTGFEVGLQDTLCTQFKERFLGDLSLALVRSPQVSLPVLTPGARVGQVRTVGFRYIETVGV